MDPAVLRLFIAVEVPPAVKQRILEAQERLQAALRASKVSWARPETFHLTLRFLGNVEESRLESLLRAAGSVCRGFSPLELRASGIGFFPTVRSPRVVWAGVADLRERLPSLHEAINGAVSEFSPEQAEGRFTGHITLGRVKALAKRDPDALCGVAGSLRSVVFGEWTGREVWVMRSELSPQGARHSLVSALPLEGG